MKKPWVRPCRPLNIISGEESDYGLYIKEVIGITADYDTDGTYWAFYIDGQYAATGVDMTDAQNGASIWLCRGKSREHR